MRKIKINDKWLEVGDTFKKGWFKWEITFIGYDGCCVAKNYYIGDWIFTGFVIVNDM